MAIRFDAGNDELIAEGWSGNVVTIIVWWRIETDRNDFSNVWLVYPNSGGGGAVRAGLGSNSDGTTFTSFDSAFNTQTAGSPGQGNWYCTAVVMNNTTWTTFHGSDPASLSTVGPDTRSSYTDPGSIVLSLAAERFDGDIAALKVYTRALSGSEIAAEAAAYSVVVGTNLVRSHAWYNSTSLVPDSGSAGTNFVSSGGAVTLVAGPPILERTAGSVTGIGSGVAFGTTVVDIPATNQTVTLSGISSAAAVGSAVVTQGLTIAAFGVTSGQALGSAEVTAFPGLVQSAQHFISSGSLSKSAAFPSQTAVAGNLIVFVFVGNRDVGTFTLAGANWQYPVNLRQARLSLVIAWKPAAGGETGVSASWTQGNDSGSQCWVAEYASALAGDWVVKGSASTNSDGTNVTSVSTSTTPTLIGSGVAVAGFGVENVLSDSVDSVNNSYTLLFSQASGTFESGIWVAVKNVLANTTTTTTLSRTSPVTADQMSAGVVVLGRATPATLLPAGIASTQAVGSLSIFGIYPGGIASSEAIGSLTVAVTIFTISPSGIASGQAFGIHVVHRGPLLRLTSIATAEAFGNPTVDYPVREIRFGSLRSSAVYLGTEPVSSMLVGTTTVFD